MKYFLLFLLYPFFSSAQLNESNRLPPVMPVSPKAAEFLKYTEVPVSKYTGVPSISIPLFNIEAKGLTVPISLTYHANGFKVNEEAGATGLGWSISSNWNIVQAVNGFDDFGFYRNRYLPDFAAIIDAHCQSNCPAPGIDVVNSCGPFVLNFDGGPENVPGYSGNQSTFGMPQNDLENFILGLKDYQPDVFIFNMPGYSGKFLLDWKNGDYKCLTDNKIKVVPAAINQDVPTEFVITVPEGHMFFFSLKEQTVINQNYSQNEIHPNTPSSSANLSGKIQSRVFVLTQIITNTNDRIGIEYVLTQPIKNFPNISSSKVRYQKVFGTSFPPEISDNVTNYSYTQQNYAYIDKIFFSSGNIQFNYSDRIDIAGAKKLDNVQLHNKTNSSLVKRFNFLYDYFIGHNLGTNTDSDLSQTTLVSKTPEEFTHRLKLLSVMEEGTKPYLFEYDGQQLPKKTSLARDYWGMYNGFLTNNSRYVDIYKFNEARDEMGFRSYKDNVNCSNLQFAKSAILNKITYPTGGYTQFEYEMNTFTNVKIPTISQGTPINIALSTVPDPSHKTYEVVTIEGGNTIFKITGLLSTQGCYPQYPNSYSNCYFKIVHFKKELLTYIRNNPTLNAHLNSYGIKYVLGADLDFLDGTPSNITLYNQYFEEDYKISKTLGILTDEFITDRFYNLKEGIVVFSVSGGCGTYNGTSGNWSQSSFNIMFNDYRPITATESSGAGIRIKSITTYSGPNVMVSKKRYDYQGGKLMSPLKFFNKMWIDDYTWIDDAGPNGAFTNVNGYKLTLNSDSFNTPSTSASGKFVGYDMVDEVNLNFGTQLPYNNGKIRDYYTNSPDNGTGTDWYAELKMPVVQSYPDNGLVSNQEIYDKDNNLIKKTSNSYWLIDMGCSYGMTHTFRTSSYYDFNNYFGIYKTFTFGVYPLKTCSTVLVGTNESNYSSSGTMQTQKTYQYNSFNQMVYSKDKVIGSTEQDVETFFTYPKDLQPTSSNTIGLQMSSKNVLSFPLSMTVKNNGQTVLREEYDYIFRINSGSNVSLPNIFSLSKIRNAKSDLPFQEMISFDRYDTKGNVLQVSKEGIYTSYVWGYNSSYPVVKLENAKYSDISTSFLTLLSGQSDYNNAGYSESSLLNTIRDLRAAMPQANVSGFTFIPCIGITSKSNPNGYTEYYQYDSNERLYRVKDSDLHILNQNEYNFRP